MRYFAYFFTVIIIIAGVSFAVLNSTPVSINYYIASKQMPLSLLLALTFAAGLLLGIIVMFFKLTHARIKISLLKRQLTKLQQELSSMRQPPGGMDG